MASTLAYTYLCLSPPFQGYHLQICKEEHCDNYKSLDLVYLVFYKTPKKKSIPSIPLDSLLWRLALELTSLPLLELGGSLAWGGGASTDTGGRLDLSFGWLKIHFEQLCMRTCVQAVSVRHLSEVVVVKSLFLETKGKKAIKNREIKRNSHEVIICKSF